MPLAFFSATKLYMTFLRATQLLGPQNVKYNSVTLRKFPLAIYLYLKLITHNATEMQKGDKEDLVETGEN
jgi:hypothetical protein